MGWGVEVVDVDDAGLGVWVGDSDVFGRECGGGWGGRGVVGGGGAVGPPSAEDFGSSDGTERLLSAPEYPQG